MSKNAVVLDFETIQCPRAIPFIPEKGPRDRTDPWEKLCFDSNYIQIAVAGFCDGKATWSMGQDQFMDVTGKTPEYWLLEAVWDELAKYDTIVTFNGNSFDIPLLAKRSWLHGVRPTKIISCRKYTTNSNHIDVRAVLGNWDTYARGKLDLYGALKFGERKQDGIDGSMVQDMWDAGEYSKIHAYCEQDCLLTWKTYESMWGYYLFTPKMVKAMGGTVDELTDNDDNDDHEDTGGI